MNAPLDQRKFRDPHVTAKGESRARVHFAGLKTLWFNTGSLCNIECANCYIASSPTADHFAYLTPKDMAPFLADIDRLKFGQIEIGLTGGEPLMNPDIIRLCEMALERGHRLLILTNAMKPLMRPRVQTGMLALNRRFPGQLIMRVSLDHFTAREHDRERGEGSFDIALIGANWLHQNGFTLNLAGRHIFAESEAHARAGYAQLIKQHGWNINADNPLELVLFPEMDIRVDVPEITTECWNILGIHPEAMMCASSRMVVRRKGSVRPSILSCTLLWDDPQFELGQRLHESLKPVPLNHPHCAKFCVLGGASCSG